MKIEITKLTPAQITSLGVPNWPVWSKEVSEFEWFYESRESCYILEGKVEILTETETVTFGKGDYVVFPEGLKCTWKVIESVKKHYRFD